MDKYDRQAAEDKLAALISEYSPVIRRLASYYGVSALGLGHDDLELEGMLGLLRAAESWSSEGGASFATYAHRCIANAMASATASASRGKHLPLNSGVPLDENLLSDLDSPEAHADLKELRGALLMFITRELSPLEREALTLHLAGLSAPKSAARLGKNIKSIENALARARRKLAQKAAEYDRAFI